MTSRCAQNEEIHLRLSWEGCRSDKGAKKDQTGPTCDDESSLQMKQELEPMPYVDEAGKRKRLPSEDSSCSSCSEGPSVSEDERDSSPDMVSKPETPTTSKVNAGTEMTDPTSSELTNKRLQIETTIAALAEYNKHHPDLKKLHEIYDTLNQMRERDNFDDFGMYIASLLRLCPLQKGMELQKEIIELIVISPAKPETSTTNSLLSTLTPEATDVPPSRSDPSQSVSLQGSSSTIQSTSDQLLILQQNYKRNKQHLSDGKKSEQVNKQSRLNGGLLDIEGVDDALRRLAVVSKKVKDLNVRDDNFNTFGSYVASVLRFLPFQEGMGLQPKIINIILRCQVNPLPLKV